MRENSCKCADFSWEIARMGGSDAVVAHRPTQHTPEEPGMLPVQTVFDSAPTVKPIEYRDVPDWPGYRVGTDGSVWSQNNPNAPAGKWTELMGGHDKDGYRKLILCRKKQRWYVRVNVLVLLVFKWPRPSNAVAAHDNGNKLDNRLDNLFWKTQKENIADKERHGTKLKGENHPSAKLNWEIVRRLRSRRRGGATYGQLSAEFGIPKGTAAGICAGRSWVEDSGGEKS